MAYPDSNALTTLARLKASFDPPIETNSVTSYIVTSGGSGYTSATVSVAGGGGSGATATAIVSGGAVVAVLVNARGKDYHAAPAVTISGDGTGATATAVLANDAALEDLIADVSNVIAAELPDLLITSQTVTERRNGQGGNVLVLRKRPATAITSLTINGASVPESSDGSAGWILDTDTNSLHLVGYSFTRGVRNIQIVYVAGLSAGRGELRMLERLCCIVAVSWHKRRGRVDQTSESAQGMVSKAYSLQAIPNEAQVILDSLRSTAVILE